ncbi:Ig-like domain-containing protein [Mesorhizobium sp.]|uniref:Ig-like domain-containing protein n=1 Tax=Mesorhizobium sp. TaxID=1871066 RepID=UPI0012173C15|nr:Ig-like domain-containing protein [Mesorhizobium sp.]TIS49137.1 MAG: hypothetical protein E5W96_15440 [Mesorhizobium sp.]
MTDTLTINAAATGFYGPYGTYLDYPLTRYSSSYYTTDGTNLAGLEDQWITYLTGATGVLTGGTTGFFPSDDGTGTFVMSGYTGLTLYVAVQDPITGQFSQQIVGTATMPAFSYSGSYGISSGLYQVPPGPFGDFLANLDTVFNGSDVTDFVDASYLSGHYDYVSNSITSDRVVTIYGNGGDDTIYGSLAATNFIYGGFGNDLINLNSGTATGAPISNFADGGTGDDTIYAYARGNDPNTPGDDTVTVHGGADNDTIIVSGGPMSFLFGDGGDDYLQGSTGNDRFEGGAGNDTLLDISPDDDDTAVFSGRWADYAVIDEVAQGGTFRVTDLRDGSPDGTDSVNRFIENIRFADGTFLTSTRTFVPDVSEAPQVTASLGHDTGSSSSDGVTRDPTLTGTGDANAVVSFTLNGNPSGWTTTADANGVWSFRPSGLADGTYTVTASETNAGGTGTASLTFTLDGTRPVVTGFDPVEATTTNASTVHYVLTFSEPVTGVDASQFSLTASGLTGASITGVEPVSGGNGTQYVVTVDTGSGDGTVAMSLDPGTAIQDFAGNGLAGGPVSFSTPVSYATGYVPTWGAIGDVNGDGNADLVLPNYYAGTVGVYLGAGDGTLGTPATYSSAYIGFFYDYGSSHAYLADVNGDGSPDIITANYSEGSVSVLLNDGSGGYQPRTAYSTAYSAAQVAIADIDGNGTLDLLASSDYGVVRLLGNGDGTFQPQQVVNPTGGDIALKDINGDGLADLLVANGVALTARINDGSGQFSTVTSYSLPYPIVGMALGDVNGDGKADIVAAGYFSHTVAVLMGDGNGGFGTAAVYSTDPDVLPFSPMLADMNGDGRLDIVLSSDTDQIGVLINNGDGTFGPVRAFPAGYADRVTVGDLNHDGLPDVVVGNYFDNTATVLLNTSSSFGGLTGPTYIIDRTAPEVTAGLGHDTGSSSIDGVTNDPALAGTSDANAVVSFTLNGNATDWTTTADANGAWTFTPTGLADGINTIVASEADAAGNIGSASLTFTLDTTPPPTTEALASDTGASASDGVTSNPALTGSGDPNAVVHFTVDGDPVAATATADASGTWTFNPTGLDDGSHTVVASETDAAGNVGTASLSFTLDTSVPLIVDIFQTQVSKKLATTTMSGHSEAGDVITLYEGANALGSATAGADGKWSISLANLSNTVHTLTTTDLAGNNAPTVIFGSSGADKIAATATGSIVIGGAGADTLTAGAGSDFFLFHNGFGKDTITGFDVHHDSLVFGADLPLFGNFDAVMAHVSDYSTKKDGFVGAVITYDKGDTIMLAGFHAADLTPESFHFIQSDFWV